MGTAAVDQLIPLLASNTSTSEIGKRDIPTSGEYDGNQDANSAIQKLLDDNRNVLQTKGTGVIYTRLLDYNIYIQQLLDYIYNVTRLYIQQLLDYIYNSTVTNYIYNGY